MAAARSKETETKQAFKTTEFVAYIAILVALFIAGAVTTGDAETDQADSLPADDVWLYAALLTIGYMISRGVAKAGSRDPYTDEGSSSERAGLGDRVKAAASAYREEAPQGSTRSEYEGSGGTSRGL